MNQQVSAFVTAWLSHGRGALHSNLLVALSLAVWQGVLLGLSATWCSPLTLHALHPQLQAVGKWDIGLLCWLKNLVVISVTPGDANTPFPFHFGKAPGGRTWQQIFHDS